jgi:hypothetical protein
MLYERTVPVVLKIDWKEVSKSLKYPINAYIGKARTAEINEM